MNQLWYWLVFAAAVAIWVAVPLVAWLERRADERDRQTWRRQPGAVPETTLRDLAADLARHEWPQPDIDWAAAKDAELGARVGHGPGRRA